MVVTLSPFKTNLEFSDVMLPIAPWTETPGTFVNAEGRVQSFHAVVKPLAETRPGWKVLRVLANMLGVQGFEYESAQEVLWPRAGAARRRSAMVQADKLSNATQAAIDLGLAPRRQPVTASIYQLDPIVRRAPSLQLTADARAARVPPAGRGGARMIDTIYGFGNGLIAAPWWTGVGWPVLWTLIKIVSWCCR